MKRYFSYSIVVVIAFMMLLLNGCIRQASNVYFNFDTEMDPQQVYVRYSDGEVTNGTGSVPITTVPVWTKASKYRVGGYLYDGRVSWVPDHSYPNDVTVSVTLSADKKPSKPADHAQLKSVKDGQRPGYIDVTYTIYDAANQLVTGQAEVFAYSAGTMFYNHDTYRSFGIEAVTGGFSSHTVNGEVTFVIQSGMTDFPSRSMALYSGPELIYDPVVGPMMDYLQVGYAFADSAAHVTPDEALPTTGANGRTLSWANSSPAVLSPAGAVHVPSSPHAINGRLGLSE